MLVRTSARLKELAVRFSLGAGIWRLCRQLLTESVTISILGGVLGVGVAYAGVLLLSRLGAAELPRGESLGVDGSTLLVTLATAAVTGLIFGSVPLLNLFRRDLNEVFRGNERGGTAGRHAMSLRSTLVAAQVSLAFILLIGSGLLTLSFLRLLTIDPGFRAENVATAKFSLPFSRYEKADVRRNLITNLLEKLRSSPGVSSSGVTTYLPFSGQNNASAIALADHPLAPGELPPVPGWNTIDSGYLKAMGIPLIKGRNIADSDGPDAMKVVLVDQFMAHKYWPNADPIGSKLQDLDGKEKFTIVGIVGSVKTGDLAEQNPVGQIYFPYQQRPPDDMHVVIRGENDQAPLTNVLRSELSRIDPELALFDAKTMPQRMSSSLLNRRAAMILCLIFAGLALLLSAIGIYGVLAYSVAQRVREIGVRMALGAQAGDVLRMILGQGVRVTIIGLIIGAVGAVFLTRASICSEVK